jgi:hypothetical protein
LVLLVLFAFTAWLEQTFLFFLFSTNFFKMCNDHGTSGNNSGSTGLPRAVRPWQVATRLRPPVGSVTPEGYFRVYQPEGRYFFRALPGHPHGQTPPNLVPHVGIPASFPGQVIVIDLTQSSSEDEADVAEVQPAAAVVPPTSQEQQQQSAPTSQNVALPIVEVVVVVDREDENEDDPDDSQLL